MMTWAELLKDLADTPEDYSRDRGLVMFRRFESDHSIRVKHIAGIGEAVVEYNGKSLAEPVPVPVLIQRDILNLPFLSRQVLKALGRRVSEQRRKISFIDSPASIQVDQGKPELVSGVRDPLLSLLLEPEAGTTQIIQLMAPAGAGKTILLEELASQLARQHTPDQNPVPLLLPIDLLGRYVGAIDDAISTSILNAYKFPGFLYKDAIASMKRRWLIVALDGFDELIARIGTRDAFLRITELLDQLNNTGTIVLSARDTFFDLFEISSAIRTYLVPANGGYTTSIVRLLPWTRSQGVSVFEALKTANPSGDLDGLLVAFDHDERIVFHPFFLTHLAELWRDGERFDDAGKVTKQGQLGRDQYVIETFIRREVHDKWMLGDQQMQAGEHNWLLAVVAEEMFRSRALTLSLDEIRLAGEIALAEMGATPTLTEMVLSRLPTHGAFAPHEKGRRFLHDQFFFFSLGFRIAQYLMRADPAGLATIADSAEFGTAVCDWCLHFARERASDLSACLETVSRAMQARERTELLASNLGSIAARLLDGGSRTSPVRLIGLAFLGDALQGRLINNVKFEECSFWEADLSGTQLRGSELSRCKIGKVKIDERTSFQDTHFTQTTVRGVEREDSISSFAPAEIEQVLRSIGARLDTAATKSATPTWAVATEAVECIEAFVKASHRTCDVAVEDFVEAFAKTARDVARIGLTTAVMRKSPRQASGPAKEFVRFAVDRERLLRGRAERQGKAIDAFWAAVAKKHPP